VTLDYDKMTKAGLKSLVRRFARHKLTVVDIEATNRPKRQSGYQIKDAVFVFETGQRLLVRVKAGGTVFQVKLNNKVIPIKHVDDLDKAMIEVVDAVQQNEKRYLAAKKKREEKKKLGKVPAPRIRTTRKEQLEQTEARVKELEGRREEFRRSAETLSSEAAQKNETLADLQSELSELQERSRNLEAELEALQQEAA
jgi:chromosome segregation ATPase